MATPDLSSVGTNSREGSYESPEGEEDLYDPAHIEVQDESFDESLEDTAKTPVVGPDDWRGESPMMHPGAAPTKRPDSANSNPDHRPLPPVPGLTHARTYSTGSSPSSPGLYATAERMLGGSHRSLPAPPPASATKSDIQGFGSSNMTLEERLKLMMQSDETDVKSAADLQRERRLRRGAGRERGGTPHSEAEPVDAHEADDTIGDISGLDFEMPPQISRESIMRRVDGNKATDGSAGYQFSPAGTPSPQRSPGRARAALERDPDVPLPSTEEENDDAEDSVVIKRSSQESGDDVLDYYSNLEEDDDDDETTQQDVHKGSIGGQDVANAKDSAGRPDSSDSHRLELNVPQSGLGIADDDPFMTTKSAKASETDEGSERPRTPTRRMSKPEYDGTGWGDPDDEEYAEEPDSPGSVIHHPVSDDEAEAEEAVVNESPAIPERIATIKAPGAKLKTRLSGTPSDLAAMREARRQVSREAPAVPPIPEKHRSRMSRDLTSDDTEEYLARHPSFKNRSLTLDIDMGLSMDQDFERVIEAQKVRYLTKLYCP